MDYHIQYRKDRPKWLPSCYTKWRIRADIMRQTDDEG